MTMKGFDRYLSQKWKKMSDGDKQKYIDEHSALLQDFDKEMKQFREAKWEVDAVKKIKSMQGLDLLKLEAKVLNLVLEKGDKIKLGSLGRKWVSMEEAERMAVEAKLKDQEYVKNLMLQVKNKKADPEVLQALKVE
mmetsp:Transcript_40886/g.62302  ORF Transcript_40886/g.62302 Transcript_40886/m.62302 type:complete len:136 (-) Transcript_40886:78-485(-)